MTVINSFSECPDKLLEYLTSNKLYENSEVEDKISLAEGEIVHQLSDDQVDYLCTDEPIEKKIAFIFASCFKESPISCLEVTRFENLTCVELDTQDLLSGGPIDKESLRAKKLKVVVDSFFAKIAAKCVDTSLRKLSSDTRQEFVYKVRAGSDLIIRGLGTISNASHPLNRDQKREFFEKVFSQQLSTHDIEFSGGGDMTFSLAEPSTVFDPPLTREDFRLMTYEEKLKYDEFAMPAPKVTVSEELEIKFRLRDGGQSSSGVKRANNKKVGEYFGDFPSLNSLFWERTKKKIEEKIESHGEAKFFITFRDGMFDLPVGRLEEIVDQSNFNEVLQNALSLLMSEKKLKLTSFIVANLVDNKIEGETLIR